MRFSLLQAFNQGVQGMLRVQSQNLQTQQQIATGQRVLTPADDPVASARIIQIGQEQSQLEQFIKNTKSVDSRLSLEESLLSAVTNVLVRTKELAIQGGDGALTRSDRESIAAELDERLKELVDIANSRGANGEYMFAGFQGSTLPFVDQGNGNYDYQGDEGQRQVQVASSTRIATSDSGKAIFVDIDAVNNGFYTAANPTNTAVPAATISMISVTDANNQALVDSYYSEDYVVTFNAGDTYTVTQKSDGAAVVTAVPYTPGQPITIDLTNTPPAAVLPSERGWAVTINGTPAVGDSFRVESTQKQSIMTTLNKLSTALKTYGDTSTTDRDDLRHVLAETLGNITIAEDNISQFKAKIGARQNTLDSVRSTHEGVTIVNQKVLSEIRDLDYAEAVSRLSLETFTLQAAQQSFAKVSNLSLFNFLR
jgi:flagellar hook-associated protein 3 FlgL